MDQAATLCEKRGTRLTDLRRLVLGLVLERDRPVGAYELLDLLRENHKGAAPPTVYRALDFLLEQGLIHRIERLSAFVGCIHALDHDHDCETIHAAQFLICRHCGRVVELEDSGVRRALLAASARAGFKISSSTIEAEGSCADCSAPTVEGVDARAGLSQ